MATKDPRIDEYISEAAAFAKPILRHIRKLVHTACPDVEETLKWRFPHFMRQGILCGMAAFKQHCALGFWKGSIIFGGDNASAQTNGEAMGQFGRITALSDLPADKVLLGYIKKAVQLNEGGLKRPVVARPKERKRVIVPPEFMAALKKHPQAKGVFKGFSYSHQKEYVEWITEAKREETRRRRMEKALEWLAQGKPRHWKYINC